MRQAIHRWALGTFQDSGKPTRELSMRARVPRWRVTGVTDTSGEAGRWLQVCQPLCDVTTSFMLPERKPARSRVT